jgi:hypothetical protein
MAEIAAHASASKRGIGFLTRKHELHQPVTAQSCVLAE